MCSLTLPEASRSLLVPQPVKIHIEQQYIHPLFSQKTELASLHVALNQIAHGRDRQVSCVRYAGHLKQRGGGRDVGSRPEPEAVTKSIGTGWLLFSAA